MLTTALIIVVIQLVYHLFFLMGIFSIKNTPRSNTPMEPVSVVVIVKNEVRHLQTLIPLLQQQMHPEFEILLLDDGSTDATEQWIKTQKKPNLRYIRIENIPEGHNSKKYCLSQALQKAQFDNILLTDADCRPQSNNWILEMSKVSASHDITLGYSPYYKKASFLNLFIRYETNFTALQYLSFAQLGFPYMGVGRNLGYKKNIVPSSDIYKGKQHMTGGDDDLLINYHNKNKKVGIAVGPDTVVYSFPKLSFYSFFKQKIRHLNAGQAYQPKYQLVLGGYTASLLLVYFFFFTFLLQNHFFFNFMSLFLLRYVTLAAGFLFLKRRYKVDVSVLAVPVLDIVYVFYYITAGITVLCTKKVKWN